MRTVAVVLAGGSGLRLGGTIPKQLQLLAGRTMLEHAVSAFDRAPGVDEIVVVMPAGFVADAERILSDRYPKVGHVIAGGADRPGSTRSAIELLTRICRGSGDPRPGHRISADAKPADPGAFETDCNVLFHDAARPLIDQRIIADCVAGLEHCQALGVVVPTTDTIAELADGVMTAIPPRESLGRCQTPQGFRLSVIRRAYELAGEDAAAGAFSATDDCGIVLRYLPEVEVRVVAGSERNLKITYPEDMRIAEAALADVGQ